MAKHLGLKKVATFEIGNAEKLRFQRHHLDELVAAFKVATDRETRLELYRSIEETVARIKKLEGN